MSARKYYRDKNGRFASVPGRVHAGRGLKRAGLGGWAAGVEYSRGAPRLAVSKSIFQGRRANLSANLAVGRSTVKRRRVTLSGGITGSIDI